MWRRRLGLPLLRSRSSSYQQQHHHHHLLPNPNEKPLALNLLRIFTSQAGSDSSSFIKPFIAFVLGGPGSGKGTQCSRIASNFGFAHLSAGDLLRNEISSGSEKGELILDIIKDGRIVPSEITVELIRKAMESSNTKRVLIDGFPRCEENRIAFERMDRLKKLKSEHGKVQFGNITMDMVLGGMRGMIGMLWETSLLDPEEVPNKEQVDALTKELLSRSNVPGGSPCKHSASLILLFLTTKGAACAKHDPLTEMLMAGVCGTAIVFS